MEALAVGSFPSSGKLSPQFSEADSMEPDTGAERAECSIFPATEPRKKGSCQKQNAAETAHEDLVIRLGYVHRKAPEVHLFLLYSGK